MTGVRVVDAILYDTLWTLGIVCVAIATVAGLWLVIAPAQALALAARLNREYSVSWLHRLVDAPRSTEPFIYRHHRVVGLLLVVATAYFFWQLATAYDHRALAALYAGTAPAVVLEILAAAFTAVLVAGNALGLVLGVVIFVRPSVLKGTEGWANRWVASDRVSDALDRRDNRPEGLAHSHPRRVGVAILAATLYIVLMAASVR